MAEHLRNRGGHVFAFEPVAANFQRLTQNIALNHLDDHVSAFNFGLGDQESQATISMENDGGATTGNAVLSLALLANDPKGTQSSIHIKRMDDIVDHLNIERADFIKVDIERAEIFFLRGARQFIEKHQPIIFGEFNSCFIERFGHSVPRRERATDAARISSFPYWRFDSLC